MPFLPPLPPVLRDLADAPDSLRNIVAFDRPMTFPEEGDDETIGHDDLRRWATAIEHLRSVLAMHLAAGLIIGFTLGLWL